MSSLEKKTKNTEPDDTLSKVKALQDRLYKACGKLDENMSLIGEPLYKEMLSHYYTQYLREFEQINAKELIDVDKEIEKLKIERAKELEVIKAERVAYENEFEMLRLARQKQFEFEKAKFEKDFQAECDKELGEIQLKHDKIKADIDLKKAKLEEEIRVCFETVEQEAEIKFRRIVPDTKPRFKLLGLLPIGKVRYNQAMELAFASAEIDISEYLTARAEEIADKNIRYMEKYDLTEEEAPSEEPVLEVEQEPMPMSKRQRKNLLKRLSRLDDMQKVDVEIQLESLIEAAEEESAEEPVFVPEPITEKDRQKVLKNLENEKLQQIREAKRQQKQERKEARKLQKQERREARKLQKQEDKEVKEQQAVEVKINEEKLENE